MTPLLPHELAKILRETPELKQSYLVGGCVRDSLLEIPVKDYDIEVFGVSYEQLTQGLSRWGRTDSVGRSFGVVKLTTHLGNSFDFTIPRRDSKVAPGHKGFEVTFDPGITPREAAARRDFTINALMYDPRSREVLDFFGGREDLEKRVLRHISEAFEEDPLRVLRGMQFVSRFNLTPAPETTALCRKIKSTYGELAGERVREEWFKWASKSTIPSAGLEFLVATGWIEHFPEIQALAATPQDPEWHPEGNVFIHTAHCCDAMARLEGWQNTDRESQIVYMLATLAHDFGKPSTTQQVIREGRARIISPRHDEEGGPITARFLERIHAPRAIQERVIPLVVHHLAHLQTITDRSVRRLAKRLEPENINGLCLVMTADHMGRPPKPPTVPEGVIALKAKAAELQVQIKPLAPILMGRHLIALGVRPNPQFKAILDEAYQAQLEGRFSDLDQALRWLSEQKQFRLPAELFNQQK
jgi:tRNA nucleotidyltransferase (CCA-adding enzyme)